MNMSIQRVHGISSPPLLEALSMGWLWGRRGEVRQRNGCAFGTAGSKSEGARWVALWHMEVVSAAQDPHRKPAKHWVGKETG